MCSSMAPTGAYFLVALDADWNAHPKNQVPAIPAVRTVMIHNRRIVTLAYWCLPKPEPVDTRPARGQKTDLR
jgi:hypothetical protein